MLPAPLPAEGALSLARPAQRPRAILGLEALPPALRPLVRAWVLGSLWTVGPQLVGLALRQLSSGRRFEGREGNGDSEADRKASRSGSVAFLGELVTAIRDGCLSRFPLFCAVLVGGSSLLEAPAGRLLEAVWKSGDLERRTRLARWSTTFVAAWVSLRLLQTKRPRREYGPTPGPSLAGNTLDLTLFAFTRAIDIMVGELWSKFQRTKEPNTRWIRRATALTPRIADPLLFGASCALIMWSFVYHPERLPRAYNRWIASAAVIDPRLLEVLRRCRDGKFIYGSDTGQAPLLEPMCVKYGHPKVWADPSVAIPLPCEMVHMGRGPSCERHALVRLSRSFGFALATYLPLSLGALLMRRIFDSTGDRSKVTRWAVVRALLSASRSSAFLASFIALFYYGVCLARSRIGPRVLGTDLAARQRIDAGICVGTGCALCGWSVLLESAGRQKDMALFVAPRALATLVPRRYSASKEWRETAVFAASAAVVLTCARETPGRVRGVLGMVLGKLLGE